MTMAVIVACKDMIYIVGDTLSQGVGYYTLNNQKIFFSDKHKIGLCIAGQGNLISKNLDRPSVYVSYIVREFFKNIDTMDNIEIGNLGTLLSDYVDSNFSNYHNYFKFQTPGTEHEKDVSYFWGGFTAEGKTAIYSHHKGVVNEARYDSVVPYFSNYQEQVKNYIDFVLKSAPSDTPKENLIQLLDQHRKFVLETYIPQACIFVNSQHPHSIGKDLHSISFTQAGVSDNICKSYSGDINTVKISHTSIPTYVLYNTETAQIQAGEPAWDFNGIQVTRFVDNTLPVTNHCHTDLVEIINDQQIDIIGDWA
jgi:hypothetical protein